jgi:hypothetical protein
VLERQTEQKQRLGPRTTLLERADFVHPRGGFLDAAGELLVVNGVFATFRATVIATIVYVARQNDFLDARVLAAGVPSREVAFAMLFGA